MPRALRLNLIALSTFTVAVLIAVAVIVLNGFFVESFIKKRVQHRASDIKALLSPCLSSFLKTLDTRELEKADSMLKKITGVQSAILVDKIGHVLWFYKVKDTVGLSFYVKNFNKPSYSGIGCIWYNENRNLYEFASKISSSNGRSALLVLKLISTPGDYLLPKLNIWLSLALILVLGVGTALMVRRLNLGVLAPVARASGLIKAMVESGEFYEIPVSPSTADVEDFVSNFNKLVKSIVRRGKLSEVEARGIKVVYKLRASVGEYLSKDEFINFAVSLMRKELGVLNVAYFVVEGGRLRLKALSGSATVQATRAYYKFISHDAVSKALAEGKPMAFEFKEHQLNIKRTVVVLGNPAGRKAVVKFDFGESYWFDSEIIKIFQTMADVFFNLISDFDKRIETGDLIIQVADGIAHEFNNILASVLGAAQLIKLKSKDEKIREYSDIIERSAIRGSNLVRKLSGYAGKGKLEVKNFDLNDVVSESVKIISPTLGEKVSVELSLSEKKLEVKGDRNQIMEVLVELYINAIDAMPEGGVLKIQTGESENYNFVSVSDTGSGMTDDVKLRIFDPFFTTKGEQGRTGLGLSMVYGVVKSHGGFVRVESKLNEGTKFELFFPKVTGG